MWGLVKYLKIMCYWNQHGGVKLTGGERIEMFFPDCDEEFGMGNQWTSLVLGSLRLCEIGGYVAGIPDNPRIALLYKCLQYNGLQLPSQLTRQWQGAQYCLFHTAPVKNSRRNIACHRHIPRPLSSWRSSFHLPTTLGLHARLNGAPQYFYVSHIEIMN